MSKLPSKAMPRATVTIDGQDIEVRGLSRAEAVKLSTGYDQDTIDDAEIFVLVCGTGVSEDEAREFRDNTDTVTAGLVIDKIIELSGINGVQAPN